MGGKRERGPQWWVWRMTWKVEGWYWGTAVGRKRGAEGKSRRHGKLSKFTFISARICFKRSSCPHWTFAVWTPSTMGRNKTALLKHGRWRWTLGHRARAAGPHLSLSARAEAGPLAREARGRLLWVLPLPVVWHGKPNPTADCWSPPKPPWLSEGLVPIPGSGGRGEVH